MAHIGTAYTVPALYSYGPQKLQPDIVTAYIGTVYIVMAYIDLAHIDTAYVVMVYIVMVLYRAATI